MTAYKTVATRHRERRRASAGGRMSSITRHRAGPGRVVTTFSTKSFKGTPSARQAVRPRPGSCSGRAHPGGAAAPYDRKLPRHRRLRSQEVSPPSGGSLARCLSVETPGTGRCRSAVASGPPPARPPTVTHSLVHAPTRAVGLVLPRQACCRRANSLSRARPTAASLASLRADP